MEELLSQFSQHIREHKSNEYDVLGDRHTWHIRLVFTDGSRLIVHEMLFYDTSRQKYSYQWMNAANELLIRWDNAHPVDLPTSPHHQHIGSEDNVQPSEPMTLADVLAFIARRLTTES